MEGSAFIDHEKTGSSRHLPHPSSNVAPNEGRNRKPGLSPARAAMVVVHRWAGLTLALFLTVAGLTGALLAFYDELYHATAPWMQVERPPGGAALLDPVAILRGAERAAPEARFDRLELDVRADRPIVYSPDPRGENALAYDEIAIDPYTGKEVYRGTWGDPAEGWRQIMPFVFTLHYTFALGEVGRIAFGLAALVWTIDCFVGFYLTLPLSRRRWWRQWGKAWRVRSASAGAYKVNFDLHRAGGLWLWPILFVFAWSSVGFNLTIVYNPVMGALGASDVFATLPEKRGPEDLRHDWRTLLDQARAIAATEGARRGFTVAAENALSYRAAHDAYEYRFRASNDLPTERGQSRLFFDRLTGVIVGYKSGRGDASADGVNEWLNALHIATIGGLAYRIFVTLLGLCVVGLSVTGVVIWMKKRSARLLRGALATGRPVRA